MAGNDPYEGFADRYHLFGDKCSMLGPEYETFFEKLFEQNRVERVLDCACGIGTDLIFFHSLGCEVHGSDISKAMLTQAMKNLAPAKIKIPLKQADFRELPRYFDERFDAVVCLNASLPHVMEPKEIVRALTGIRNVLREDGIFILDQGMCDKLLSERPRFIPVVNGKDFSRIFVVDYFPETLTINVLDLFHGKGHKDFRVFSFDYRIILQDDYEAWLHQAGFRDVTFFGTYSLEPYDKKLSDRLILVARK